MDRTNFHYDLPTNLIAQEPLAERKDSRLLVLRGDEVCDKHFFNLPNLLAPGDLLVLNDTRVIPARFHGQKSTGGGVEVLLERITGKREARVQIRASKSPRPGTEIIFSGDVQAWVKGREGALFDLAFNTDIETFLKDHGKIPLPPYIDRIPGPQDEARYQTVYARENGAVAAPTAGLHFDDMVFTGLQKRSINTGFLTLHVGAGTFTPVRTERIEDHTLHGEWASVSEKLCDLIIATKARGGRVVAVGTTVVRALESAALDGALTPFEGETNLFIYPGFTFQVVDALITNFHLPESSLLMLVSAFAGQGPVLEAYRYAVTNEYRFFSYGDAMLVMP
jgi:S-adenosylmethionine:tRNA ribosyltransferase-isomerase